MIRLYGPVVGSSSFARVAAGMRHGLSELGHLDGFVPVDAYDEEEAYPGHKARIGVFVGPLNRVDMMTGIGWHEHRLALVPANSTWMPEGLIRSLEKIVTGFLAPSAWAAGVLRGYTDLPVSLWRHGVTSAFRPDPIDNLMLVKDYEKGDFRVGHLASTHLQRKGTRELVRAWCRAVFEGALGEHPLLTLVVDGPEDLYQKDIEEVLDAADAGPRARDRVKASVVRSRRRWNMDDAQAANWYRKHHLIAQPSRGEGFGLVPLEARACGVPVLMTYCTGHAETFDIADAPPEGPGLSCAKRGVIGVQTGENAPIDDGPGAMAPELAEDDVLRSLVCAYQYWSVAHAGAQRASRCIHEEWNWTEVTRLFLKEPLS